MDVSDHQQRCLNLDGRQTCVELDCEFRERLDSIADQHGMTVEKLSIEVARGFDENDLAAALRVFVLTTSKVEVLGAASNRSTKACGKPVRPQISL